jgi:glycerol-3-phosphate dehydrogenase
MAIFARVAEAKSFSGAARRLGISKSAVSKHVARLERELKARLLNRTTRTLSLKRDPAGVPLKEAGGIAFEYSDCWVEDARLVVLNAMDARERGAIIETPGQFTFIRMTGPADIMEGQNTAWNEIVKSMR